MSLIQGLLFISFLKQLKRYKKVVKINLPCAEYIVSSPEEL